MAESSGLVFPPVTAGSIGSARAAAFARCDLGGDHPPGDRLAAPQLPEPRRGPDDHPEPAARVHPEQAWPDTDGPRILALARQDPDTQMVSLVLDATTANIAMYAIAAHADEREAHLREVERSGHNLPEGSYGRRNRQATAARETRIAIRLRAVEQAYRTATEHGTASRPPEPTRTFRSPERQADREIELE